jgi:transposase
MRSKGSPAELERRRRLAMERRQEGYTQLQIANFLGVAVRTVQRWESAWKSQGEDGLAAIPASGRPPKLTARQAKIVLSWLRKSPTDYDFIGELWTAGRVAQLIERQFGVRFHPHYISHWLSQRGISPQKPKRQAVERNERKIKAWVREVWPQIVKKGLMKTPMSY